MIRPRRRSGFPIGGARLAVVVIVLAQWFGTSLWFSPSGAAADLSGWLCLIAMRSLLARPTSPAA